jgi:hypothetical protein
LTSIDKKDVCLINKINVVVLVAYPRREYDEKEDRGHFGRIG